MWYIPLKLIADHQGQIQPLTALSPTLQLFPLPTIQLQVHFLFKLDLPTCNRSWLVHYQPTQGITGQWLAPPPPMQCVWRAAHQAPLFFSPRHDSPGYFIYEANGPFSLDLIGRTNALMLFLGWNDKKGQLVATNSWFGETYLSLLDPSSGFINRLPNYQSLNDGSLLYRTSQADQHRLQRYQISGRSVETLAIFSQPFWPVWCP